MRGQVTAQVQGELLDGFVAAPGIGPKGHEHDVVKVSAEPSAQGPRQILARGAARLGAIRLIPGSGPAHRHARPLRFPVGRGSRHAERRVPGAIVRFQPGEQRIQHEAQGVHVARRGDRLSPNLLGARVVRCQEPHHALGCARRVRIRPVHDLGDPEIQQFGHALRGHQDIARLQIAVNDQPLVCVLDRRAHLQEQPHPLIDIEVLAIAVRVDRLAGDELHDEVRQPRLGRAAVQQPRDIRMIEAREDLALVAESLHDVRRVVARSDQLDGNLLLVRVIRASCPIDLAHSAGAYQLDQAIRADVPTDPGVRHELGRGGGRRIQEFIARRFVRREQRFELAAKLRIFGPDLVEEFAAQLGTQLERLVQRRLDLLPALRFHDIRHSPAIPSASHIVTPRPPRCLRAPPFDNKPRIGGAQPPRAPPGAFGPFSALRARRGNARAPRRRPPRGGGAAARRSAVRSGQRSRSRSA
jgi:hypothetical protein